MKRHLITGFVTLTVIFVAGLAFIAVQVKVNNERISSLIRTAYPLLNRCNSLASRIDLVLLDLHRLRLESDRDISGIIAEVELIDRESSVVLSEEDLQIPAELRARYEREMTEFKNDIHEAVVSASPEWTDRQLGQASQGAAGLKEIIQAIKGRAEAHFVEESEAIEGSLAGSTLALAVVLVSSLAFSMVVVSAVVRGVNASLNRFLEVLRHLSEGDFAFRLGAEVQGFPSEFKAIAGSMNQLADRLDAYHRAEKDRLSEANRNLSAKNEELAGALSAVQEISGELQASKELLARKVEHLEALHRLTEFGLGADSHEVMGTFLNIFFPRFGFREIWIVEPSGEIRIVAALARGARKTEGMTLGTAADNPGLPRLDDPDLHTVMEVGAATAAANRALSGMEGTTLLCLSVSPSLPLAILAFHPGRGAIPPETVDELATASRTLGLILDNQRLHSDLGARVSELASSNEELTRVNEELERVNRELRGLDEMKDGFISSISHELRTPLAAIKGAVGLVSEMISDPAVPSEEAGAFIDIASRNCERLIHLINEILDLSRIQSGRVAVNRRVVPVAEALDDAVEVVSVLARAKGLSIDVRTPEDALALWVDRTMVHQVLVNLLSNAVKFSGEGQAISVSAERQQAGESAGLEFHGVRDYARLTVGDRGIGIAPGDLERIFDHFYQVDMSSTRSQGGAGLGLAITQGMVAVLGGRIWVRSTLGEGTDFHVLLPLAGEGDAKAP